MVTQRVLHEPQAFVHGTGLQPRPCDLARAAALEYGRNGIRVNSVSPGLIDRPGLAEDWPPCIARWTSVVPLDRLGQPEDVADAVLFLASPASPWITGADLLVDGGISTRPTW